MVNLTIGGGNFKGISYVGALEYLYQNNMIKNIENFYGSSVGTIIGIFYIIGYTPFEIFNILLNLNLQDYWDFSFNNIEYSFSLISDSFFKKIKEVFEKMENSNITFIEFYNKYNVKLNLFATSLTQRKNVCFNIETYPNANVFRVLQASCSIPLIFPPVNINDEYYIDGCMKCIDGISKNIILNDENIHFVIKGDYSIKKISSFVEYISEVINCTLQNEENFNTEYTISIKTSEEYQNKYNFNDIKFNDKIKLFYLGLSQAKFALCDKVSNILLKINEQILDKQEKIIKEKNEAQKITNEETNQETNKETNEETNQETNKETNEEINIKTNKETNEETNQETNKETQLIKKEINDNLEEIKETIKEKKEINNSNTNDAFTQTD